MTPTVFSASRPLLVLAPMAGYTNLPFRELIREKAGGLDWTVTELVNARSLMERRDEALKLSKTTVKDSPCFVQLFSGVIRETAEAARIVEAQGAAGVDINMGCPAPKVIKSGGGSALLADPEHAIRLVEAVVQAVKIPVTVKTRLGMTPDQIVAPKLAHAFQELGVQAVTIHGRTRAQGFSGNVDLDGIREVVQAAPKIPVLANGDVTTAENAIFMLKQSGAAGLSIGRGAFYNPWLFSQIRSALTGNAHSPVISFEERLHFMTEHLQRMIEAFGEFSACSQFRKIAPFYTRRMGPSKELNRNLCQCETFQQYRNAIDIYLLQRKRFLDENGELRPNYRPVPVHSSLDELTAIG